MTAKYIAFTYKGERLANDLALKLGGEVSRCGQGVSLAEWTSEGFACADALVFIGAVGIAVRAIAPHCRSKAEDPAVIVVDECGRFAIPVLSGHLGGANDFARRIAAACGAVPVITTATDLNGVFAVDEWTRRQNCAVIEPERIKRVSGALLAGQKVKCFSSWPVCGELPAGVELAGNEADADFCVSVYDNGAACLHLAPRVGVLGIGCRRGISARQLDTAFENFLATNRIFSPCICSAATIDLKRGEAGLLEFCQAHGWPLAFYSASELENAKGEFTASAFVREVTGVDNVCERAAALASEGGVLAVKKQAGDGVTFALALKNFAPDWRWRQ